ncbi:DMT family transporter [Chryseolinea lacunae]|uniref:DMT family transporter n=1 Tax=Chryseolinea lacunae TaxID=2801331 RepID=A0ABS1KV22_9BACT|nr:DMT family transporter [Chryseolinea lacunae]MBL0742552.1 DMT family transporter [Chryseolinea lacunae]
MATRADYLKLHFIVFLWGFSAILGKLVSIPTMEMVFFRALLAALGLAIVIYARKESFTVPPKSLLYLILIGFVVALHWVSFFGAGRVANVSVSLVGFATNSLWTAVLEPWLNRTRIKKFELVLGCLVLFGLYVIFSFDFQYKLGLLLGIMAGLTSALFSIFNSRMVRTIPSFTIAFYEMIGCFLGLALFLPVYKMVWGTHEAMLYLPTLSDWLWIALLAGVCSVYAYSTAVELMKKISVFLIQLTLNLEPVYGIIMAVLIFGASEKMGTNFYVGTGIIMSAVIVYPFLRKRFDQRKLMPK